MAGTRREDDRRRRALAVLGMVAALAAGAPARAASEPPGSIERIELKTDGSVTKVFVMLSRPLPFEVRVLDGEAARKSARRLVLDFANTNLAPAALTPLRVANGVVLGIRTGQPAAGTARVVLDLADDATHSVEAYETPPHVTIVIARTSAGTGAVSDPSQSSRAPDPAPPPPRTRRRAAS